VTDVAIEWRRPGDQGPWPPPVTFMAVSGQNLMAADRGRDRADGNADGNGAGRRRTTAGPDVLRSRKPTSWRTPAHVGGQHLGSFKIDGGRVIASPEGSFPSPPATSRALVKAARVGRGTVGWWSVDTNGSIARIPDRAQCPTKHADPYLSGESPTTPGSPGQPRRPAPASSPGCAPARPRSARRLTRRRAKSCRPRPQPRLQISQGSGCWAASSPRRRQDLCAPEPVSSSRHPLGIAATMRGHAFQRRRSKPRPHCHFASYADPTVLGEGRRNQARVSDRLTSARRRRPSRRWQGHRSYGGPSRE